MKSLARILLVLMGSLAVVLASFAVAGFPFPSALSTQLIWVEAALLLLLLGVPLLR